MSNALIDWLNQAQGLVSTMLQVATLVGKTLRKRGFRKSGMTAVRKKGTEGVKARVTGAD